MNLKLCICDQEGNEKQAVSASGQVRMVYNQAYVPGDEIRLTGDERGFIIMQLEDSIEPVFGLLDKEFCLKIPFGDAKLGYSPKSFVGETHTLCAHFATVQEIGTRRNLARNAHDSASNDGFYPHASANVETRNESVFAARNAIDGSVFNEGHGAWPYQSWGINQDPNAAIRIDFGRLVVLDSVVITLRADFPHDNYWKKATLRFSDGTDCVLEFCKTEQRQIFELPLQYTTYIELCELIPDETDSSPFPALTQIEAWGVTVES